MTKADIAEDLAVPLDEIESLIFGLAGPMPIASNEPKVMGVSLVQDA